MSTADTEEINSAQMLSHPQHPSPLTNSHPSPLNPQAFQPTTTPGTTSMPLPAGMHNNFPIPQNSMRNPNYPQMPTHPLPSHMSQPNPNNPQRMINPMMMRQRPPFPPRNMPPRFNPPVSQPPNLHPPNPQPPPPIPQPNSELDRYLNSSYMEHNQAKNSLFSQSPPPPSSPLDMSNPHGVMPGTAGDTNVENVRKVERFLLMLISLAKQKGRSTHMLMQCLVQNLLLGYISEEVFMQHLEQEMDCPPQEKLLFLLQRNMPSVRKNFFKQNPNNLQLMEKKKEVMLEQQRQLVDEHRRAKQEQQQQQATDAAISQGQGPGQGQGENHDPGAKKPPSHLLEGYKGEKTFLKQQQQQQQQRFPSVPSHNGLHASGTGAKLGTLPVPSPSSHSQSPSSKKHPGKGTPVKKLDALRKKTHLHDSPAEGEVIEDEDDSDITVMANIDLNHERQQMAPTQTIGEDIVSVQDRTFIPLSDLYRTVHNRAPKYGIDTIEKEACIMISHALEERVRSMLEHLSEVSSHRNLNLTSSDDYEVTSDIKQQLRAIERVDQMAVESKLDREKKMFIKVSKQRMSKSDDPELNKMKEIGKKLKKEEEESIRKMAADVTALKMTVSRKKASSMAGNNSAPSPFTGGARGELERGSRNRARQVRVTMKDLSFFLSQERDTKKSIEYYKALLK